MKITWLILLMVAILSCKDPEPESYLIPQGFTGRVNVIFGRKDGVPTKYVNGRRVYDIPHSGILLTQFNGEFGIVDHQYYFIDSAGKQTTLEIFKYVQNQDGTINWIVKDPNKIGIFSDGTTGKYGSKDNTRVAKWQEFVVSSYNGLDRLEPLDSFENRVKKVIGFND